MGRFYFHLKDGDRIITDEDGLDLPDLDAARREAILGARELLADAIKAGKSKVPDALVIADEAGRALEVVPLVDLLPEPLKK